jgi:sulfatase modifying factor 1
MRVSAGIGDSILIGSVVASLLGCGDVPAAPDGNTGDAVGDKPALMVEASPSTFVLHVNDTRETVVTVKNVGGAAADAPTIAVADLTLGTMTFANNTCTGSLAAGATCTAVGTLTATTPGTAQFQITATATSVEKATATLPITAMAACPANCGPNANANCCASSIVPGNAAGATNAGMMFYRGYDVATDNHNDMSFPATVSDFRLDTYEVTVGRFRAFVEAGMGTQANAPAAGAGAHAKILASGWDAGWNGGLSANTTTLKANLKCQATHQTWTDSPGSNENLPMTCTTWYEAFAFCIWDGGYLPTEVEWNYAASGGSEQRAYPWSSPASSTTIDCSFANYYVNNPAGTYCVNGTTGALNRVGSESPKGDGRFGQSDLAGNVYEWNLDSYNSSYPATCNDCADLTSNQSRVYNGGSLHNFDIFQRTSRRNGNGPEARATGVGVRCARMR